MNAKQIWINGEHRPNTWMCLVKEAQISSVPKKAMTKIAVDSKYWLWINGETAVFEGGVKRGPSRTGTYYDEIDIARYLKEGKNKIAVLVWYFGDNGFSHLSSGQGGLLFDSETDALSSDNTWKIKKNPAFTAPDEDDMPSNFRLAEPNIYFDAAKALGEWYLPGYDASDWQNADITENSAWGELKHRIIPMLKDYGLKDYENSAEFEGITTEKEIVLKLRLPYNAQLTPYLKITSPAGKKISVKTDTYDDFEYNTKSVMAVYYTKDGIQEYESFGFMNGESVYYTIPEGVTIHSLKFRETGYDAAFAGSFECDDEFLNKLWKKSLRTLYITMRDNFMDCPDRERAQWWGDVNVEMQMMMYALDKNALLLYKKGADLLAGWAQNGSPMLTVAPSGKDQFELPFQNLAGIWGFSYYYDYTADLSLIERVYSMSKNYVSLFEMDKSGLVMHRLGTWDWQDWGENSDTAVMENAWYYMALESCRKMAGLLEKAEDFAFYKERMKSIRDNYDRCFWKNGYYYDKTQNEKPDDRANALAVLSGLAERSKYESIIKVLKTTENASPYMEKYVLDAMCEMGYIDDAVDRIKRRYKEMVDYDYSTLWEYWNTDGTLNHAWSGGPLVTMSKYLAGIRPIKAGYDSFEIKPHLGKLKFIKCAVPTVKGNITAEITKKDGQTRIMVEESKH